MFDTFGISTGICVLVLFPVPKLPYTFCPHVYTFPSTFNAIPPESFASILTILFMFAIFVNAGVFLMLVSWPSSPNLFIPVTYTSPELFSNILWFFPPAISITLVKYLAFVGVVILFV